MKAAIFDFDGTLFPVETIPFLLKQYPKLGYSKIRQWSVILQTLPLLIRYKVFKTLDKERFRKEAVSVFLKLFNGMTESETRGFFEKNVPYVLDLLDQEVVNEAKRLKKEGYYTLLLSGCFDMLLNAIGEYIEADEVIGTCLIFNHEIGTQKVFDSQAAVDVISGHRKAEVTLALAKEKGLDLAESIAYADSYYDRDILELVGHKVGVNPDEKLEAICQKEGWKIMKTTLG